MFEYDLGFWFGLDSGLDSGFEFEVEFEFESGFEFAKLNLSSGEPNLSLANSN